MSEDGFGADEILEALGLAILIVEAGGTVSGATSAGVALAAKAPIVEAAVAVARAASGTRTGSARVGDRRFLLEARPLGAERFAIVATDITEASARREALAIGDDEGARAMVAAVIEPLVRDRAAEALASIRAATEALDRGAAATAPGSGAGLDVAVRAAAEAEARIKALLTAARSSEATAASAARGDSFELEGLVASVAARHKGAFAGRGRLRHAAGAQRFARADAGVIGRALGLFLESVALRFDPEHATDNAVSLTVGDSQGRPYVDAQIVGHLLAERAVGTDDLVRRALGGGSTVLLSARALAATGGGELARTTDPAGHLAYRLALSPAVALTSPTPAGARRGRVLAIDDEPMLVSAYQRMMRRSHDIVPCVGGAAALDLLAVDKNFDLVLCDLVMPQVSGIDVYNAVQKSDPEIAERFVFLSGGAYTQAARGFLEESGARCLDKPVEVPTLLAVIAEALEKRS